MEDTVELALRLEDAVEFAAMESESVVEIAVDSRKCWTVKLSGE